MTNKPISVFIAMAYTDLGEHKKWRSPQEVEKFYRQEVCKLIAKKMKRPVEIHIEKDVPKTGLVFEKMSRAIHSADVFIADLTAHNANVFLELGIRYGLSQAITILTTQEDRPVPFDLNQMSVINYAKGSSSDAAIRIANIVVEHHARQKGGSPVLTLLDLEVVPHKDWEIMAGKRVEFLIAESKRAPDSQARLDCVLKAVQTDPFSETAHIELARVHRARLEFDAALGALADSLKRFPESAQLYKECGIILDRMTAQGEDRLDEAIAAYGTALKLNEKDADLHSCYGGALRRKGLRASDAIRSRYLEDALDHYRTSLELERHSTYAGLNVLRLLMLGVTPPKKLSGSIGDHLKRMFHLCAFEVTDSQREAKGQQWWSMFDYADVLALQNDRDQALDTYQKAIEIIPIPERADTLVSPKRSWQELLEAGSLEKRVSANAERILSLLDSHVGPSAK